MDFDSSRRNAAPIEKNPNRRIHGFFERDGVSIRAIHPPKRIKKNAITPSA